MAESTFKARGLSERGLIEAIRKRARGGNEGSEPRHSALRLGIGDDCAILRPAGGEEIVVTTDLSLEGVHFRRDWHAPEQVGHRCLARGLSDLAAMGARPVAAFFSMGVPEDFLVARRGKSWVERFFDGFMALADRYAVPLAGGDTARDPERACFDIVLLGAMKRGRAWLRSGAKAGDAIYVTGALGGAAAELMALERGPRRFAALTKAAAGHPHLFPEPRLDVAKRLAALKGIHAAIDVSDGFSTDLMHICEESGLSAEIDAAVPVDVRAMLAEQAGWAPSAMELALHGGEDYELLFTAADGVRIPRSVAGVEVRRIGRMVRYARGPRVKLRDEDGGMTALEPGGWEHFGSRVSKVGKLRRYEG
jgi:thiamine-monophosphate kinase